MSSLSAVGEERRQNQYLADLTQPNEERQRRNATTMNPNTQETRDHSAITLMFIVASDPSEAQRERLTSFLCPGNEHHF